MDERQILAAYPADVRVSAAEVAERVAETRRILVVLDDDPTGTQSVSDLPVLTSWAPNDFEWAFGQGAAALYVLTNTRSLDADTAAARNREIVRNAVAAAERTGRSIGFVSRSDSTLRGHYPLETDVIAEELLSTSGVAIDGVVMVPAFPDADRVTIGGVHYMRLADGLTPVAETEFARDSTFGFVHSDLPGYVQEKTGGRVRAADVIVLDLTIIRSGAAAIAAAIAPATRATPICADAVTEDDLRLLALGLHLAEDTGKKLLYRVGPPFVRARIGQESRAPLTAAEVYHGADPAPGGGLIVVGSHVGVTTRQLAALVAARPSATTIELDVARAIDESDAAAYLETVVARVAGQLRTGDVILHTSRLLLKADDPAASLDISRRVSAAVVTVVRGALAVRSPRFVIAKGGITSSDVASEGLGIRRAIVRGPMLPGIVSLWEPVDGPAAGIPYIVFAGNVGDDDSLAQVVATLSATAQTNACSDAAETGAHR
ncbi:four-carbon acid sugar kinase family protein [Cryobacterium roopkundense]|uniref:Uncharacterized protein YgbK (DUF1537 family) n=1 Tax=Cryobacterium roopkundense TaxID=1001240 RepID=A0A7W9E485_9MICO|nr:four-carbon acid sugar kinase family protein [Cryobacterium roopkundense]MBB5641978.1 uncharacterized protein YgbK (DUF1537 family) [Cryobacterium roopkundense]